MTKWTGVLGAGAAAAAVGAGLYFSGVLSPDAPGPVPQQAVVAPTEPSNEPTEPTAETERPAEPPLPDTVGPPDPQPPAEVEEKAADAEQTEETPAAPVAAPAFDVVRVEPDGSALVAGSGQAGATIRILLDGQDLDQSLAGADGKFASLLFLTPSDKPRLLSLAMMVDGKEYLSASDIIVAPFKLEPEPQQVEVREDPDTQREEDAQEEPAETELASLEEREAAEPPSPPVVEAAKEEEQAAPSPATETVSDTDEGTEASPVKEVESEQEPEAVPTEREDATPPAPERRELPVTTERADAPEAQGAAGEGDEVADADRTPGEDAQPITPADQPERIAENLAPVDAPAEVAEIIEPEAPVTPDPPAPTPAPDGAEEAPSARNEQETTSQEDQPAARPNPEPAPQEESQENQDAPEIREPDTKDPAATDPAPPADPPTLLAADEEGVRVLSAPEVLDSVAIDTISYDAEGDVALAGRGAGSQGGGFVRIYLDNSPITSSRIRDDGSWRVALPEVDKGVYTLRVDEVDEDGKVKSRAETPFQREDRETLERVAAENEGGGPISIVTVQPGNTLWQIARERYGEGLLYVRVFDANRGQIRNPDLIYPGQVFDLPDDTE